MHCRVLEEGILTWPEIQIKCIIQPNALTCKDKHESQCYKASLQKKIVEMKRSGDNLESLLAIFVPKIKRTIRSSSCKSVMHLKKARCIHVMK